MGREVQDGEHVYTRGNITVVSSAYPRLLIFLLAIFIPAHASPKLAFHIMHIS